MIAEQAGLGWTPPGNFRQQSDLQKYHVSILSIPACQNSQTCWDTACTDGLELPVAVAQSGSDC